MLTEEQLARIRNAQETKRKMVRLKFSSAQIKDGDWNKFPLTATQAKRVKTAIQDGTGLDLQFDIQEGSGWLSALGGLALKALPTIGKTIAEIGIPLATQAIMTEISKAQSGGCCDCPPEAPPGLSCCSCKQDGGMTVKEAPPTFVPPPSPSSPVDVVPVRLPLSKAQLKKWESGQGSLNISPAQVQQAGDGVELMLDRKLYRKFYKGKGFRMDIEEVKKTGGALITV